MTNAFRAQNKLAPVRQNPKLTAAARAYAKTLTGYRALSHTADGTTPSDRVAAAGYRYCQVGENLATILDTRGFTAGEYAKRAVQGWENSPGHRKNMLDPDAMDTAVAVARSACTGRYYAVQMFGRPRSATYSFQVANQSGSVGRYQFAGKEFELQPRGTRTHEHCRAAPLVMHGVTGDQGQSSVQPAHGDRFLVVRDRQALRLVRE